MGEDPGCWRENSNTSPDFTGPKEAVKGENQKMWLEQNYVKGSGSGEPAVVVTCVRKQETLTLRLAVKSL